MAFPLRLKYVIEPKETKDLLYAKKISSEGIISLRQRYFKNCSCGNRIYQDSLKNNQISFCSCGKRIRNESFKDLEYIIDKIHYEVLIKLISERLNGLNFTFLKNERIFKIEGEKIVYILIPEFSYSNFILSQGNGDNCLFIVLDSEITFPLLLPRWSSKSWFIGELLEKNKNFLKDQVIALQKNNENK